MTSPVSISSSNPPHYNNSAAQVSVTVPGVTTISELLANANGLSTNNSIAGALAQQSGAQPLTNAAPSPNSVLASTLSPSINLSSNNALQVANFVDVAQNAFPTQAPAPQSQPAQDASAPAPQPQTQPTQDAGTADTSNVNNQPNGPAVSAAPADNTPALSQAANSAASGATPTGIYTAVASVNASTLRGSGVDTSA